MPTKAKEYAFQNMTEGSPSADVRNSMVFVGCEVDKRRLIEGMPDHYKMHMVPRDKHQAIMWNPREFKVVAKGYVQFHKSGDHEKYPYGTPSRGLIWVRGHLADDATRSMITIGGMWWLNSWFPMRGDKNTAHRRRVVETTTIPKVEQWIKRQHKANRSVILGGDINSMKWDGELPGMKQVNRGQLDRAWVTRDSGLIVKREHHGPKVGVGNQMRHNSLHLDIIQKGK